MFLSYSELFAELTDNFNVLHLHLAPLLGMTWFEFCLNLRRWKTKLESLGYCMALFRDPAFRRFSRTPTCDRQTDTWLWHMPC